MASAWSLGDILSVAMVSQLRPLADARGHSYLRDPMHEHVVVFPIANRGQLMERRKILYGTSCYRNVTLNILFYCLPVRSSAYVCEMGGL